MPEPVRVQEGKSSTIGQTNPEPVGRKPVAEKFSDGKPPTRLVVNPSPVHGPSLCTLSHGTGRSLGVQHPCSEPIVFFETDDSKALKGVYGVSDVDVSLAAGEATVKYDEQGTSPEPLKSAVQSAGYGLGGANATHSHEGKDGCCG